MSRSTLELAVVVLLAGCAHGSSAGDGYTRWHTVTTAHFALHTPAGASTAEDTALQLERVYEAMAVGLFPHANLERIDVLLFQEQGDAARAAADARAASGQHTRQRGAMVLALRDRRRDRGLGTAVGKFTSSWQMAAARELAQRFLEGVMDHPPQWLRSGLSRYLGTAQVEEGTAIFGRRPDDLAAELRAGRAIALGELLEAGHPDFAGDWRRDYEASAWGFVHYLLDGEQGTLRPRFDKITSALLDGASGRVAVERAFPDVPFPVLEGKVRDYLVETLGRRPTFHPYPVSLPVPAPTRGTATAADPARMRALLLGRHG